MDVGVEACDRDRSSSQQRVHNSLLSLPEYSTTHRSTSVHWQVVIENLCMENDAFELSQERKQEF